MTTDIIYFMLLSSPISAYLIDGTKFCLLVCFNCIFKCFTFSSEKDDIYTKKITTYIKDNSSYIQKKSIDDSKEKPEGYFFSLRHMFFGNIHTEISQKEYESKKETVVEFYGKLPFEIKTNIINISNNVDIDTNNKKMKLFMGRGGSNHNFRELEIYYNDIPYPFQQEIIESIIKTWKKSKFQICRALICGKTNIGKITIGRFTSIQLNGCLCFDIDLFAPGNSTMKLYDEVGPTEDNPLIIQIDEFDKLIDNIHNQRQPKKVEWLRNMVYNKPTYNSFMSEYVTYLPNVIWLFTTKEPLSYFDNLDKSYINTNRIDYKKEIF